MLRALTLLAFLLTGPGLSGAEVAAHLLGLTGEGHTRTTHVEAAGGGHDEHCSIGLVPHDGRTTARRSVRKAIDAESVRLAALPPADVYPRARLSPQHLSRAPPGRA